MTQDPGKAEEISQEEFEKRQRRALVTPSKKLIQRFIREASEEGMTDAQIKFGIKRLIEDHQKKLIKRAKAAKAAEEVIDKTMTKTEEKLSRFNDESDG